MKKLTSRAGESGVRKLSTEPGHGHTAVKFPCVNADLSLTQLGSMVHWVADSHIGCHALFRPGFAVEAGMAALHWLVEGYGYEVTGLDVSMAYSHTMKAAENAGRAGETQRRIRDLVARESCGDRFVTKLLGRRLGLS